ncbi:MAG: outer membrane beta-barrel protein [Candidatus Aminicenantes bacterium]|nr:outer membrane beta-barrel protein [Candidatus Aminicenantes bacterium]
MRIGPFRIVPRIGFQFLRYESNVFYQREEENPASDFTSTISPELNVYLIFKDRLILSLADRLSYVHYYKYKEERRLNNNLTSELKLLLFNRFVLSGTYANTRDRGRPTSEFNIRANEYRESFRGRLFYETSRLTSIGITFSQSKMLYDDITFPGQEVSLSRILNRKDKNIGFEFNYLAYTDSFFFITADYTNHDFEHIEEFDRRSYSLQALTGLRFPLLGGITGTLAVGYKQIVPRAQGMEGKTGLIGNTALYFRSGSLGARIAYNKDFPFSQWDNNVFFINNRYLFGGTIYLSKFLRIDYDYSLGSSKYPELIPFFYPDGSIENIKRIDNYFTHTLRFVFRLFNEIGLGISANQWSRDSNYLGERRSQIFFDASLTLDF